MTERFSILVVCRANVCRSPLAEILIRRQLDGAGLQDLVDVTSSGTSVLPGDPMCGAAATWAHHSGFRSWAVTTEMLAKADLILGADRENVADCAQLAPSCRQRLFTLPQAAFLAGEVDAGVVIDGAPTIPNDAGGRLRWLVGEWDAARVLLAGRSGALDEIPDRHGPRSHDDVFVEIERCTEGIATALTAIVALDQPAAGLSGRDGSPGWQE